MKFELITKTEQFEKLHEGWDCIASKSPYASISQTWEWMKTWWDVYGSDRNLAIVCAYQDRRLVGIAPLSIRKQSTSYYKLLKFKTINILGNGKTTARGVVSDYLDFIIEPGFEESFLDGFWAFINKQYNWDEVLLENISVNSSLPALCEKYAVKHGLKYSVTNLTQCALIKLPNSWDEFLQTLSNSMRYKINRGRKELKKLGGRYRVITRLDELPEAFKHLEHLHQHRWKSKGEAGAFSSKEWKNFHRKLMPLLLERGMLRLSFIEIENNPVASNYSFLYDKKIHFFQSGLIPHENKHVRLGFLLHSFCIEDAIKEGCVEYDFLSIGASGPGYKSMWTHHFRDLLNIRVATKTNKENVLTVFNAVTLWLKAIKSDILKKLISAG